MSQRGRPTPRHDREQHEDGREADQHGDDPPVVVHEADRDRPERQQRRPEVHEEHGPRLGVTQLQEPVVQAFRAHCFQSTSHALKSGVAFVPEISANKYALNIRFVEAKYTAKTALYDQDVAFDLTFCSLS